MPNIINSKSKPRLYWSPVNTITTFFRAIQHLLSPSSVCDLFNISMANHPIPAHLLCQGHVNTNQCLRPHQYPRDRILSAINSYQAKLGVLNGPSKIHFKWYFEKKKLKWCDLTKYGLISVMVTISSFSSRHQIF